MTTVVNKGQVAVGLGITGLGLGMAAGAWTIPADAGYAGIGPNFLPWVVAIALALLGVLLIREAVTGGYRDLEDDAPSPPFASGFGWISTGLMLNAILMTQTGFIIGCAVCFMFAAQGLRQAQRPSTAGVQALGQRASQLVGDFLIGLAITAPVYWMFTKLLAIKLPGLTETGWI